MEEEIWKDIEGTNYKYKVSSTGRVMSYKNNNPLILKPKKCKNGYLHYSLRIECKNKWVLSHRLTAAAFIDNPSKKLTVNHKNGNKSDNRVENLEWATYSENNLHSYSSGLKLPRKKIKVYKGRIKRIVLNKETGIFYFGISDAAKSCHIKETYLTSMLNGTFKNKTSLIYV